MHLWNFKHVLLSFPNTAEDSVIIILDNSQSEVVTVDVRILCLSNASSKIQWAAAQQHRNGQ